MKTKAAVLLTMVSIACGCRPRQPAAPKEQRRLSATDRPTRRNEAPAGASASGTRAPSDDVSDRLIEEELAGVKVDSRDLSRHLARWLVKRADVAGQWDSSYWHDGVHLTLTRRPDGRFEVVYHARGDLMSWTLRRRASFADGVLQLDKPVEEYGPYDPYQRFYLLRIAGELRFVSQGVARGWLVGRKPEDWNSLVVDEMMLKRSKEELR